MIELNRWQKRFWVDSLLQRGNAANIAFIFRVTGPLNIEIFTESVRNIVRRTESLRCVCRNDEGGTVLAEAAEGELCIESLGTDGKQEDDLDAFGQRLFDLEKDLPLRISIRKESFDRFRIVFVFHHICVDLVSLADFWDQLSVHYTVLLKRGILKPTVRPVLKDYLKLEKNQDPQLLKAGIKYWRQYIERVQPAVILPSGTSKAGCIFFDLGPRLHSRVSKLARELKTTPFRVLMSAWLWTLSAYSGNRCPAFSYAVNVRPVDCSGLIAPFVNNLPWGMNLEDNPSFRTTVAECTHQRQESRKYQEISITDILESLRRAGVVKQGEPFLNTAVNYAPWGNSQRLELTGTVVEFERRIATDSYFDLTLEIEPEAPGRCRMIYNNNLSRGIIEGMERFWIRTLNRVCRNADVRFAEIPLLTPKERATICARSGEMKRAHEQRFTHFLADFRRMACKFSEKIAIITPYESISYRNLEGWSDCIAALIRKEGKGRPVGVCLERNCNYVGIILGILKSGLPYVPLDAAYPSERLKFMARDCGMRTVVTQENLAGKTGCRVELYIEKLKEIKTKTLVPTEWKEERTAYIIYTSGTTGKPKGVPIAYGQLQGMIRNAVKLFCLTSEAIQMQFANLAFDASVMEIFPALSVGASLCLVPENVRKNPFLLVNFILEYKVTTAYIAPVILSRMEGQLPGLKVLSVGGESTPADALRRWSKGRYLMNLYGPTECTVFATACRVKERGLSNDIGAVVEGMCAYVMDEYGRLLPIGVSGELCLGGKQLTSGYLNRDDLNRKKFIMLNGYHGPLRLYRTGDRVVRKTNGHFLFLGRIDSQVKIRGFRVELGEIEATLNRLKGVRHALVMIKGEGEQGKLVAYVQPDKQWDCGSDYWREQLMLQLPSYMQPSSYVSVDAFPLTPSGKIDRRRLPEPEENRKEYIAPANRTESDLARIAGKLLNISVLSVAEDLFYYGLSSLTAVILSEEAERMGIKLPVSIIYREHTLQKMARVCGKSNICYWYTPPRSRGPVVVLICGHSDFDPLLRPLADELKTRYAVLVVNSYHDYDAALPDSADFKTLLALYEREIAGLLPYGSFIYAFTGHCFGGEIAYALAARWAVVHAECPEVWMFNSLAIRNMPENWIKTRSICSDSQQILWEITLRKQKQTACLVQSEHLPVYRGRVVLFVASRFTSHLAGPGLPGLSDRKVLRYMKNLYRHNPENWRVLADRLEVYRMLGDHWSMMRMLTCIPVAKTEKN